MIGWRGCEGLVVWCDWMRGVVLSGVDSGVICFWCYYLSPARLQFLLPVVDDLGDFSFL